MLVYQRVAKPIILDTVNCNDLLFQRYEKLCFGITGWDNYPKMSQASIWRFPKIGVPPNRPFIDGFPIVNHPFWGTAQGGGGSFRIGNL